MKPRPGSCTRHSEHEAGTSKPLLSRRVDLLAKEGITFTTNTEVGKNYPAEKLLKEFDAVVICTRGDEGTRFAGLKAAS